jgi:hypothetical protein
MLHGCFPGPWPIPRVVLALLCLAGCGSVSPERVQAWKATPEGRERLVGALRDSSLAVPLRAQAAAALTEVGWVDRVESAVAGMPFDERGPLIVAIPPLVAPGLDSPQAAQAWDAREALLVLRRHATTDEGTRVIDGYLLPALERDLRAGRLEGGRHSLKEMLTALGPAALPALTRVMTDDKAPFATAVELIDKVGDQDRRDAGSAALVKRARSIAVVPPELWQGLSTLGGKPAITFLEEVVTKGSGDAQTRAAEALAKVRIDPSLLPFALRMARDVRTSPPVRGHMLSLAERIGSEEARKGMIEIIATDPDRDFRFKAFAAVIHAGSGRQLLAALEAFPVTASYQPDEIRARLVEPIAKIGYAGRTDVFRALASKSPLARLVGLWALEKSGFASDAPQVAKRTADRGVVKGFPPRTTIGSEATRVVAVLKKRPP